MYAKVLSSSVFGIDIYTMTVEANTENVTLFTINIVDLLSVIGTLAAYGLVKQSELIYIKVLKILQ